MNFKCSETTVDLGSEGKTHIFCYVQNKQEAAKILHGDNGGGLGGCGGEAALFPELDLLT